MIDKREKAKVSPEAKAKGGTIGVIPDNGVRVHEILSALATAGEVRTPGEIPSCPQWSVNDYRRFIEDRMSDADKAHFITHSEGCDICQQGLGIVCEEIARQRDTAENERLFRRTRQVLDQFLVPREGPVTIVARLFKGAVELLSFAGSVLQMPTLQPVRGEASSALNNTPLLLEKEFSEPPLSVQLSLMPDQGSDLLLGFSVFDREQGEFRVGLVVEVDNEKEVGEGMWQSITDDDGTASLTLPTPGRYRLRLIPEESPLTPLEFMLTLE